MRHLFASMFLLLFFQCSFAQSKKEPKDTVTVKKVLYSEIVRVDSSTRFELYKKAAKWIEGQAFEIIEEDPYSSKIIAKHSFIVYTDKGVLAKPNGDFSYDIVLEAKEGKYRYTFSNFVYRRYKQDRQDLLKYIPVKGKKPIEDTKAPGWKKQWIKDKMQVSSKIEAYIVSLNNAMKYMAPKAASAAKPKEEW